MIYLTTWWMLCIVIFACWVCFIALGATAVSFRNAVEKVPVGQEHGFSAAPIVPVLPMLLFGIAKCVDHFLPPWGTLVIEALHGLMMCLCIAGIIDVAVKWRALGK
jgi:hypothetical protein